MLKERIHIVPIGYEIDRIVQPLIEKKADKVYLITQGPEGDKAKPFLDLIKKKLEKKNISFIVKEIEIKKLDKQLNLMRKIIFNEEIHQIYINVSSGSKISTVAGMMAAMMFKSDKRYVVPYYVEPETYDSVEIAKEYKENLKPFSMGVEKIFELPNYKVYLPDEELTKLLIFIYDNKDNITKKKILTEFMPKISTEVRDYMKLRRQFLDKLEYEWKLIETQNKKNSQIKLKKNALDLIKFLKD